MVRVIEVHSIIDVLKGVVLDCSNGHKLVLQKALTLFLQRLSDVDNVPERYTLREQPTSQARLTI